MKNKKLKINIIGATGLAGKELVSILEESKLNIRELDLYASKKSAGEKISFREEDLDVKELKNIDDIDGDLAFLAIDSKLALEIAPKLVKKGIMVIDKSSAFRKTHPLIIPSVNGALLENIKEACILSSPNCVAVPLITVLFHINKISPLMRTIVSTYQAVSGAGNAAFSELETQVRSLFNFKDVNFAAFDKQIAFNVLANIPSFGKLNSLKQTDEEEKVIDETKKILGLDNLFMQATCVRVPVFNGHSMSVDVETSGPIALDEFNRQLSKSDEIIIQDDLEKAIYPCPLDAGGRDEFLVGRIRKSPAFSNGISFWISADNLRVGAALNAVRIAERIYL